MGKREKGRRHRRVNRTPRPVGRSRTERGARSPAVGAPAAEAVAEERGSAALPVQARASVGERVPGPEPSVFASKADGGLGRPARRTWSALRAAGARESGVEELCAAVGFAQRTVAKHLEGLAGHGLAVQGTGGGWVAIGGVQGLPEPRPADPPPAGSAP
ncbi:hypothetical protein ACGFXC_33325 [Streptomyces sp. NPDC048507]|uniref:hypothetical protein n=1 Tax=Streptomyces sp. NPDC048507 TaxID=3365560 RepID=UPI003712CA34